MPDQRLDFAVATRVLSPRAFLTSSAEPEAALATVGTQELPDGAVVFVRSVRSWFRLNRAAGGAPDGITIVDAQGPGQWERFDLPDSSWLTQAQWHINATTGSDENDGSAASPLASWAELSRRWGADPVLPQTTDVFIESDLAEKLWVRGTIFLQDISFLRIRGSVAATLHAGTITAKTNLDPASQQPSEITDAAVGDWDTAGPGGTSLIGQRIRLTSGANAGAVAWLAKRLTATTARTSPFGTLDTSVIPPQAFPVLIDPSIGDDYAVEQLTNVEGVAMSVERVDDNVIGTQSAALIEDLSVTSAARERFSNQGGMAVLTARSRIGAHRIAGGRSTLALCALSVQSVTAAARCFVVTSLLDDANDDHVSVTEFSRLALNGECLVQGTKLQIFAGSVLDSNGFAVFDTDGTALVVFVGGFAGVTGLAWGTNNALFGIECQGTARVAYNSAFKPILTGTGGDTIVGDAGATAYAAIPLFNTSDGSAIVEG